MDCTVPSKHLGREASLLGGDQTQVFQMVVLLGDNETNLEAIEWDQDEIGRDQNKVKNNKKLFLPREQNNDYKTMEKVLMPQEHNNEIACNETMDSGEHTTKNEQQMTYHKALLGLDNSEMSSDF